MADFNRTLSGLSIIQNVCGQLGLPVPAAVATDPANITGRQMLYLLNSAGLRLVKPGNGYRWQVLKRTWQLPTVPGQTQYDLPADFDSFIDQTAWNKTALLPLLGPMGDAGWAAMSASVFSQSVMVIYRTRAGKLELFSLPDTSQELRIDYTSRAWAQRTGAGAYIDTMTDDGDVCLYDSELITAAVKLRWLIEKGFDTMSAQNDYDLALELAINADTDAAILDASAPCGAPLLSPCNLPTTGYGAQ